MRLNSHSGVYGVRRKEIMNNLFRSIIEMAMPGFMMYIFKGFEDTTASNGSFFDQLNEGKDEGSDDDMPSDEGEDIPEYRDDILGFDQRTGKEYMRQRKRKPNRYLIDHHMVDDEK
jgi:hypothetical protein